MKIFYEVRNMEKAIEIMINNQKTFVELRDDIKSSKVTDEESIIKIKQIIKNNKNEKDIT